MITEQGTNSRMTARMENKYKNVPPTIALIIAGLLISYKFTRVLMIPVRELSKDDSAFVQAVARADSACPVPVALGDGEVTGIVSVDDYLIYHLEYDKGFHSMMGSLGSEEQSKEALLMYFLCGKVTGGDDGELLMDLLIDQGYGMKIEVMEAGGYYEYKASVKEIERLRDRYRADPHEALHSLVALCVETLKSALPQRVDKGLTISDIALEKGNVVITMLVDEHLYSVSQLEENSESIKASIMESGQKETETKPLFDLCELYHTGLIHRFEGNRSHDSFDILIPWGELHVPAKSPAGADI